MKSRARSVSLTLLLAVCSLSAGCTLSDRLAVEGIDDRGLLVVHPARGRTGAEPSTPLQVGFEVLDEMGQVVRWVSGAWGARVSVLLRPGIYEVRSPRESSSGAFAHVRAGEVTRVDLTAAAAALPAGGPARSWEGRGGP